MESSSDMNQAAQAIRVLTICGSLRAGSANAAVLRAATALAPAGITIAMYGGLGDLPHFNPDQDGEVAAPPVADFRRKLTAADGILISCPEYAHGVPGVMKNALDWLVRSGELVDKPVALISASPHAKWALASLTETLTVMSARLVGEASITLPLTTNRIDEAGLAANAEISLMLQSALAAFARVIRAGAVTDGRDASCIV
jgi:chromate reductase